MSVNISIEMSKESLAKILHNHLFLAGDLPISSWTAVSLELRPLFWDS